MASLTEILPQEFPDPDRVGQSEYRAIYDCCQDALDSADEDTKQQELELLITVLEEFVTIASDTITDLRKRIQQPEGP